MKEIKKEVQNLMPNGNTIKKMPGSIKVIRERMARNKEKFLENYADCKGIVTMSCEKTGIAYKTFYQWRKQDPEFGKKVQEADEQQCSFVKDILLEAIMKRDITAVIFYLKNKHPEFKQGQEFNLAISGQNQILVQIGEILNGKK